ncbi:MAG: SDR family oxidoreductase [Ignavibacteriales bacterium]|nr:SDR family oxidoreductase [Ignavibacteriales bacterium]
MKSERVFLLFGASGALGRTAVDFFLNQDYDQYYFFTREKYDLKSSNKKYEMILISDMVKEENVAKAFQNVIRKEEANYFLFSTIGAYIGGEPIIDTQYADFLKMLNINLCTAFLISKHFSKLTQNSNGSSICFTSAQSSLYPEENRAAYNISKHALNFLVKTLSFEGKRINLSANAVAPYIIDSAANREWVEDTTQLVTTSEICNIAHSFFQNYKTVTGNIVELPGSIG